MSSMTTERVYDIYDGDETGCSILFHVFDIWITILQKAFGSWEFTEWGWGEALTDEFGYPSSGLVLFHLYHSRSQSQDFSNVILYSLHFQLFYFEDDTLVSFCDRSPRYDAVGSVCRYLRHESLVSLVRASVCSFLFH
jgi:hypothetical protein